MTRIRWRDFAFFFVAVAVVVFDQLTKALVRSNMVPGQSIPEDGIIRLTYVRNAGVAFGLVLAKPTILIAITILVCGVVLFLYLRHPLFNHLFLRVALALVLGGAVGNLIDRLRLGYVTDFIDIRVWPIFNLADSATVAATIVLACYILFPAFRAKKPADGK